MNTKSEWISVESLLTQKGPIEIKVLAEAIEKHEIQTIDELGRRIFASDAGELDRHSKAYVKKHLAVRYSLQIDPIPNEDLDTFSQKLEICGSPLDNFGWPKDLLPDFTSINPNSTTQPLINSNQTGVITTNKKWQDIAREIAEEQYQKDFELNSVGALNKYKEHVFNELKKLGITGPQGKTPGMGTIAREALQGDNWWKHKVKAKKS